MQFQRGLCVVLGLAGCSSGNATTGGGGATSTTGTGGAATSTGSTSATSATTSTSGAGTTSTTATSSTGVPVNTALIRVHYPNAGHTMALRGSAPGLSWTQGQSMPLMGNAFVLAVQGITAPAEIKPVLDDTTWARGPNYHLKPGETLDLWPHFTTIKGQVVTLINTFHSTVLQNDRSIYAYLPPSYAENPTATYPVVYMHDGQNLWAALPQLAFGATWNVDTTFDAAAENGACGASGVVGWGAQPLGGNPTICTGDGDCTGGGACDTFPEAIIIGVANTAGRIYEYTPTTDPSTPGGGGADLYVKMLVTELKPAIDGMLRTRPDVGSTVLAGSSLGGLVTAYAGLKHPEVFGRVGEFSPSTWWNNTVIIGDVQTTSAAPNRPLSVYLDCGDTNDDQADTDMLAAAYVTLGYQNGTNFRHVVQPGANHNEVYWAQRFPGAMQLLLGAR